MEGRHQFGVPVAQREVVRWSLRNHKTSKERIVLEERKEAWRTVLGDRQ